jgi:hypothetical protein
MARRTNQLNFDRLETRDLMAGNLSAVVSNGILFVKEGLGQGNTNNAVRINQLLNGKFRVTGLSSFDGKPTKINGADFKEFVVPTAKLNIKLGGGDDLLFVSNANLTSMLIATGASNLADTDQVFITGVRTRGGAFISTGGGVDSVVVQSSKIGDGVGTGDDLSIFTGAGSDAVSVGSNDAFVEVTGRLKVTTFSSTAEQDADSMTVRSVIVGNLMALDMGGGNDQLRIENSFAVDIVALTGTGHDEVALTEVRTEDQFFVFTDSGNDTLDMVFLSARDLAVNGGTGFDKLTKFLDGPTNTTTLSGWESINGVTSGGFGPSVGGGTPSR